MNSEIRKFAQDFVFLVKNQPEHPALIVNTELNSKIITYQHLEDLINRCLCLFQERGLQPGDRILSLLPNTVEAIVIFLSTIKGGYGYAPLNCSATRRELDQWINLIRPKMSLTTSLINEDMQAILGERCSEAITIETNAQFDWLPEEGKQPVYGDEPRLYLSTSGTTGAPKSLVIDSNILWSSGCAFMNFHGQKDNSLCFWNYLPMSYLGGLFNLGLIPLCAGGSIVIDEPFSGKTFLEFWQTVDRYNINALWFVPSIVRGLLKMAERTHRQNMKDFGKKIKIAFLGTAPINLSTKQKFEEVFGIPLLENFALSETTFFTTETIQTIKRCVEASVGEVLAYAEVKFVPTLEDKQEFMEIFVRSPFLFLGYLQQDGSLLKPFDSDGFFKTEDFGYMNKNNDLVINGRKRDIIKKGGHFVSLKEIEVLAETHPAVREAAAVSIPHEFYGESSLLFVHLNDGFHEEQLSDISKFLHQNIVQYKWPEKIVISGKFSRTPSGKIQKHLLAQEKAVS